MPTELKLRGHAKRRSGPYPLGEIPHNVATEIGKHVVHRLAVGHANIGGDDFGEIFARAIGGTHRNKPLGIADVVWEGCAWSVKTVQGDGSPKRPVRLISGRNAPFYSSDIQNPYEDLEATGKVVLGIWNARVDESFNEHDDLRIFVMIRNMTALEFTLMEFEAPRFVPANYYWKLNKRRNLEGYDREGDSHKFTWQPSGSQFTIFHKVPASAYRFRINQKPRLLEQQFVLDQIQFRDSWIEPITAISVKDQVVPSIDEEEADMFPEV